MPRSDAPGPTSDSRKRRQLYQIIPGYGLRRISSFAPGRQSADNYERVESVFPQHMRHPGAGRFALSSTVDINVFVLGQGLEFFGQIIWFQAD